MFTSYPQCRLASKPQEEDSGGFGEWLASVQTDKLARASQLLLLLLLHIIAWQCVISVAVQFQSPQCSE